ncbi:MAG: hypothetical protein HY549_01310 [Elusimicrobia bacterium]|nr:hypothetical protein [Elusimicrobiota bacterium]
MSSSAWSQFAPFGTVQLGGNQAFFDGKPSSLGGYANLSFVPALRLSPRTSLIPRVQAGYQGINSYSQVIDEGSLLQQQMNSLAALKYIYKLSEQSKLKTEFTGKHQWLKEANNEPWGKGLYDYRYYGLSGEWEHRGSILKNRLGLTFSVLRYPNYQSLSSAVGLELGGKDTLDTNDIMAFYALELPGDKQTFKGSLNFETYAYTDQKLIDSQGAFIAEKRLDKLATFRLGYSRYLEGRVLDWWSERPSEQTILGLDVYSKLKLSNQNHYDVEQLAFIAGFYDYITVGFSPSLAGRIAALDLILQLYYDLSLRRYFNRPIQDADSGLYQGAKLRQTTHMLGVNLKYPLTWWLNGLMAEAAAGANISGSNMKYEKLYRYNYSSFSYQMGLRYDF